MTNREREIFLHPPLTPPPDLSFSLESPLNQGIDPRGVGLRGRGGERGWGGGGVQWDIEQALALN